jgi:hypothetical protein
MEKIKLSGKEYPIRFDFRALKEYKSITKNDLLVDFEQSTDNVAALAYVALKSGYYEENPNASDFNLNEESVSRICAVGDLMKIVNAFMKEINQVKGEDDKNEQKPGEIPGTA